MSYCRVCAVVLLLISGTVLASARDLALVFQQNEQYEQRHAGGSGEDMQGTDESPVGWKDSDVCDARGIDSGNEDGAGKSLWDVGRRSD